MALKLENTGLLPPARHYPVWVTCLGNRGAVGLATDPIQSETEWLAALWVSDHKKGGRKWWWWDRAGDQESPSGWGLRLRWLQATPNVHDDFPCPHLSSCHLLG